MKPAFRYYGGKARIAQWVVSLFPQHESYVEPFFGSGAVFFAKPPSQIEIINDLDGEVVNFFRVVRDQCDELVEALRLTPYSRDEFNRCKAEYSDSSANDVERARRFFTVVSQSFACTTGTAAGWSCTTINPRIQRVRDQIDGLHDLVSRLSHVQIENTDAADVIRAHNRSNTLVYCDPPYVFETRSSTTATKLGDGGYRHEMTDDDHRRLAAALMDSKATVLLSGYESVLYRDLFAGWYRTTRRTFASAAGSHHVRDASRTEVIWSNRPINDGRLFEVV